MLMDDAGAPQFVGPPCGQYGAHTFFRGFRYTKEGGKTRDIGLGEFFFVRISAEEDPCIGELQLLCSSRNNEQHLSAVRLYFLPEQTPDGRLSHHGEDEVLVASDRVVLKLEDLVSWITDEVEWNHGKIAPHSKAPKKEEAECNGTVALDPLAEVKEPTPKEAEQGGLPSDTRVCVLSYGAYCRYRTMLKRLDGGCSEEWLRDAVVIALGGFCPDSTRTHVLFCRDTFEHDELAHHELNCEYLAPTIKGKKRKRKTKNTRSISPESNTSEECKTIDIKNQKTNGIKQPPVKNEQEFLQRLFKFMKKRNTPIHRVPHLGFKQIDLYVFFSFAQKLGGYDKITTKKLWKHVYDELGGNPGSTSAATCTRRHYERLLLPFERFMEGIIYKPAQRGKKGQKKQLSLEDGEGDKNGGTNPSAIKSEPNNNTSISAEAEDAYAFTDSNHENSNSKDSNSNEFTSVGDEQTNTNEPPFSDEDSKTVWSIQKQPDNKDETDKDEGKPIKPLIIQKGQGESFAEKERKWDEIRRKNAAARKWVRQSRSNRGCKTPIPEIPPFKREKPSVESENSDLKEPHQTVKVKSEIVSQPPCPLLPATNSAEAKPVSDIKAEIPLSSKSQSASPKFLPPVPTPEVHAQKIKTENHHPQKRRHSSSKDASSRCSPEKKYHPSGIKAEHRDKHSKSWCGYPVGGDTLNSQSLLHAEMNCYPPGMLKGHMPPYKAGSRSEPDVARDYPPHTGRHSVGSMSASSVVSVEASPGGEEKPLAPQRRPSVIQHTEYAATSPSPSASPKQTSPEVFTSPKVNLLPTQLSYSLTGKVAEWLTKGVHEVVACKTPTAAVEKYVELHDKVMMPSSCKTPGVVGTSKVPVNNVKTKPSKTPRSKYSGSSKNKSPIANGTYPSLPKNDVRGGVHMQKMHHPVPYSMMPQQSAINNAPKYQQTVNQKMKMDFYPNGPYYSQSKRYKVNAPLPSPVPPARPSPSPFVRQQTYCTPPFSDVPKPTPTTHNDYQSAVLDLSVKKKPPPPPPRTIPPPVSVSPVPEGVCLDLSIKKKPPVALDNGIENITPPLPLSPNPPSQVVSYMNSSLKPLPTLIALQDLAAEDARRGYSRLPPGTMPGPPLVMPGPPAFHGSTHSKMSPGLVNSLPPVAYSKDMAKNLFIPGNARHSQFPPYVIPSFFPSNWTSVVNASAAANVKPTNNSQTSPMTYKDMVNHSVFPKDYPYNVKSQYHPVLCKDSGHYPSNDNK